MNFSRLLGPILMLGLLVFLATACGDGLGPSTPAGPETESGVPVFHSAEEKAFEPSQELLSWIFNQGADSNIVYEVAVSGKISVDDGGGIIGKPSTWPLGFRFTYWVLPGSIDRTSLTNSSVDSVTISILVPVADTVFPPEFEEVMPMILEPDGMRYLIPENAATAQDSLALCAHVWFSYHPNLPPSCEGYEVFSADETETAGVYYVQESYIVGGQAAADAYDKRCLEAVRPEQIIDPLEPWLCSIGIYTRIQHHSRWGVVKNDGGGGGGTTTIPDLPNPLD